MVSQNPHRKANQLLDLKVNRYQQYAVHGWQADRYPPSQLQQLALATGIDTQPLLRRMMDHGLRADNILALRYAPIAEVAWASGQVTNPEYVQAVKPIFSVELFRAPAASELFRSWLRSRPDDSLWTLWTDVTQATVARRGGDRLFGQRLYDLARDVALASGGLLDEGDICRAERAVLGRIAAAWDIRHGREGLTADRGHSATPRRRTG